MNSTQTMEPSFTSDWFSHNIPEWNRVIAPHLSEIKAPNVLEIGAFEGRASLWFVNNFPGLTLTVIDPWDFTDGANVQTYDRFLHNISPFLDRVTIMKGRSELSRNLPMESFDVIYVDGEHTSAAVLHDAAHAYDLLKSGGLLIFDDYLGGDQSIMHPKPAIDFFHQAYSAVGKIALLSDGYQRIYRKVSPGRAEAPSPSNKTLLKENQDISPERFHSSTQSSHQQKLNSHTPMNIHRVRSQSEFQQWHSRMSHENQRHFEYLTSITPRDNAPFTVKGYSYTAGKEVDFLVDFQYSRPGEVNWRERVVCPLTNFNNRMRAAAHLFDTEMGAYHDSDLYLTEQVTPVYSYFKKRFPTAVGSEFLADETPLGGFNKNLIRNEDLTALSFPDDSFDFIISFDVLEHVPAYEEGFKECFRVLRDGGKMMWSVPFNWDSATNIIRAKVVAGKIVHILPPEYHGDPVSSEGILCFQHFGWEMLQQVRDIGFRDSYAALYSSVEFGYLGQGLTFLATK